MAVQNNQELNGDAIPFSEALEKTGFGIFNYFLILVGGLVLASVLYETSSISFILPIAECDLKLTNQDKGVLSAIGFVGVIVSSHLWGFLADTKGRRAVMLPTILIGYFVTLISSFSHRFWMLVLLRFINGFFVSGASATIYAYLAEFHIERTRSRALMAASCIFSVGAMMLPLIAWGVINRSWSLSIPFLGIVYRPWRLYIVACGTLGIVSGLAFFLLPESPKFLLSTGREKEAIEILKKIYKWNSGRGELKITRVLPDKDIIVQSPSNSPSKSKNIVMEFLKTMWKRTVPIFRKDFLRTTVIICTIQFWMFVTIHGMYMWFPYITDAVVEFMNDNPGNKSLICDALYAKQAKVYDEMQCTDRLDDSTYLYSLTMEVLFGLGFVVIGIIGDKVQPVHIISAILVVFGACGVITNFISSPSIALAMYVLFFISGVGVQVLGGFTADLYPTHVRGMALSISLMFGRIGGVVGANIVGLLLSDNCEMTFYISAIPLIACGILIFFIPQKSKFADEEDTEVSNVS